MESGKGGTGRTGPWELLLALKAFRTAAAATSATTATTTAHAGPSPSPSPSLLPLQLLPGSPSWGLPT